MNKPINKMDALSDMARFPWAVHLGASLNIVFSVWLTYRFYQMTAGNFSYFLPFAVALIGANLLPVVLLRRRDSDTTKYRSLGEMDFFRDQHRFSTWVYGIASGNMLFWTVFAWWTFSFNSGLNSLYAVQVFSFIVTFVPLWRNQLLPD